MLTLVIVICGHMPNIVYCWLLAEASGCYFRRHHHFESNQRNCNTTGLLSDVWFFWFSYEPDIISYSLISSSVDVNVEIKHWNLKTTVNNSLKFSVTFRQQLLSSSNCCLLSSAKGRHREQKIVVDVAQLVTKNLVNY